MNPTHRRSRRRVASLVLAAAVPFALLAPSTAAAAPPGQAVLLATGPVITSPPPVSVVLLGAYFTHTFVATGDPAPTWSYSGRLPRGLTLDPATGTLSGVPTASLLSASVFTVTATNSAGAASQTATILTALTLGGGATTTRPVITSQPPAGVVLGTPYAHRFTATGTPAPTWSHTGALPAGLTLDPATGLLSGTPTGSLGTTAFTVTATNPAGSAQQPVTIVCVAAASAPQITSDATLAGTVGTPFAFEATASGIPAPTWSVQGALPAGIVLDPATGILTGTPTAAGTSAFTLVAANSAGSDRQQVTFVVAAAGALPVIDPSTTVVGTVGQSLTAALAATGSPTWVLTSGSLPAGLTLDTEAGIISGTPTAAGTSTVTLSATNVAGVVSARVRFVLHPTQLAVTPDPGTLRYSGEDRVATSVDTSRKLFPTAGTADAVVVTTAEKYADALGGGRLASANGGPLLLSPPTGLPATVAAEVSRVLAPGGTVFVLGGEDTVSPAVAASLQALPGGFDVQRLAGRDRFETAVEIATEVNAVTGGSATTSAGPVYLVNGRNFPDGLAVSALAARTNGVVLLTDDTAMPAATAAYLAVHDPTGARTVPVGGFATDAAADLPTAAARAAIAQSIVGADRYDTAARVAGQFAQGGLGVPVVAAGLATGENWPDALVGAAALGALNSPLLLTPRDRLDTATQGAMAGLNTVHPVWSGLVFGGTPSLSAETMVAFAALVPGDTTQTG